MSTTPVYTLELRAADQRRELHGSILELKERLREKMDIKNNVRPHVPVLSGVAGVFGLLMGYGFAGVFTRH
jgi:hypothetical protein